MSRVFSEQGFELGAKASDFNYSLRRYWVDEFHFRYVPGFKDGGLVLNLGGLRILRRGVFRIDPYGYRVVHLNLTAKFKPEVIGDGLNLPFSDNVFDAVIMSELLEHVSDPGRVLSEAARVLKPGGKALITTPFNNPIHADPQDFGRYTETFYRRELAKAGLEAVVVENQGRFFSVLADMLRDWLVHRKSRGLMDRGLNRLAAWAVVRLRIKATAWDGQNNDPARLYQKKLHHRFRSRG